MNIIYYRNNANEDWQSIPALKGDKGNDGTTPIKGVDYFTEEEITDIAEQAAALVDVPEVDLSAYALKEHAHEQYLTEHQDLSGYATTSYVNAALEDKADASHVHDGYLTEHQSLEGYATESYVGEQIAAIDIPVIPANISAFTNDAGYLTEHQSLEGYATESYVRTEIENAATGEIDLSSYALKSDIPVIPANISAFTNDAGYLTEHQSLEGYALKSDIPDVSGYATEDYVDGAIAAIEIPREVDLSAYALKSEIPDLSGYATESYVRTEIENAAIGEIDLSSYALKSEIPVVPTNVSAFTNDTGYLTEHQDLSAYALKTDIPDVSGYQTESQVQALIDASLGVIEDGTY